MCGNVYVSKHVCINKCFSKYFQYTRAIFIQKPAAHTPHTRTHTHGISGNCKLFCKVIILKAMCVSVCMHSVYCCAQFASKVSIYCCLLFGSVAFVVLTVRRPKIMRTACYLSQMVNIQYTSKNYHYTHAHTRTHAHTIRESAFNFRSKHFVFCCSVLWGWGPLATLYMHCCVTATCVI